MKLYADHSARSDVGLQRKTNEDTVVAAPPLFAVCDGMGGALAGEVASGIAADVLEAAVAEGLELTAAAQRANAAVYARAQEDAAHAGMGTTLTALLLDGAVGRIVHVGDSRAYLLREGELTQITADHSMVAELMRTGRLTEAEAATHPHRSVLTRALGTEAEVQLDEYAVDLLPGDVLLLCSDGLSGPVSAATIARSLAATDPDEAARRLVREARRRGGPDNISVVVVRLAGDEGDPDDAVEATGEEDDAGGDAGESPPPVGDGADAVAAAGRRRRRWGWFASVLGVLTALGLAGAVVLSSVFFISVDDSRLAVYSGLPVEVGPVPLYAVYRTSTRPYASLTAQEQVVVDARELRRKDAALELARELEMWP